MKKWSVAILGLLGPVGIVVGLTSQAIGEELDGAELYKQRTCIACHGADARTPILPEYPTLAGQSAAYALQQMKDIKSGARSNGNAAAMQGVMHLVTEEEMQAIALWLSAQ